VGETWRSPGGNLADSNAATPQRSCSNATQQRNAAKQRSNATQRSNAAAATQRSRNAAKQRSNATQRSNAAAATQQRNNYRPEFNAPNHPNSGRG